MAVGVTFAALEKVDLRLALKDIPAFAGKRAKIQSLLWDNKNPEQKRMSSTKKYIQTESGIACARYIYISFLKC